jgi:3',5'-cyclic AMP phosphodiesterase CpdA
MMAKQRKMLDLSEAAWIAMMDTAMKYQPSLLLIPGDLTKDSEKASHELVANSLRALEEANIKTFVIPGNHDIGGNAYRYEGTQKIQVDNLPDEEWESTYSWIYDSVVAKDPSSHSYVAEPLEGLSILGIDGAHNTAGTGWLSDETLAWILAQADSACAKGNTIIAMCHWQILEHFDKQSTLESACRLKDADAIRDSLMHHGVRLVLTGHFHVNSITTWRDTTGLTTDSIVEISTGSPITYPCPYRWLTVSDDRRDVQVETGYITSLDTIPDMTSYSREWMAEHTEIMIPTLALRAWQKVDNNWSLVEAKLNSMLMGYLAPYLKAALPQTDSAKIDLVQRHIGNAAVNLYLFHSEANENERPEIGKALADSLYNGMENMLMEVYSSLDELATIFATMAKVMAREPVQSLVEDVTLWSFSMYSDQTDDLHPMLRINSSQQEAVENVRMGIEDDTIYDILGRPVTDPSQHGVYIQNGQKIIR